jgi:hypothetical protein
MKKLLLFSLLILSFHSFSQNVTADTTKKDFKNVIGIDVTSVIRQFFISGNTSPLNSNFPTIISYRRIFKSNAAKIALGVSMFTDDRTIDDTIKATTNRSGFTIRLGFEHYCYLGKRWMYYFGADALIGQSTLINETSFSNISSSKSKAVTDAYGFSPVLGITFKINDRLFIATESSLDVILEQIKNESSSFPGANVSNTRSNRITTTFNAPQFINLRLRF